MIKYIRARLSERSTWAGAIVLVAAFASGPLGLSYADVKDAVIFGVLGAGMIAAPTTKGE